METAIRGVYAIGDVLGPTEVMPAHVASTEGQVAAQNTIGSDQKMDYSAIPGGILTTPEVVNSWVDEHRLVGVPGHQPRLCRQG